MYKICFFVPHNAADAVKQAMFAAGAGRIGNYEECSFETEGYGQFKPINSANPAIGSLNQLEKVAELKIEMVCNDEYIRHVIDALKKNHPYEMPAYDVIKLIEL